MTNILNIPFETCKNSKRIHHNIISPWTVNNKIPRILADKRQNTGEFVVNLSHFFASSTIFLYSI